MPILAVPPPCTAGRQLYAIRAEVDNALFGCAGGAMREDDMLRLSMSCARLVVAGEPYEQALADGVADILQTDGGTGVTTWTGPPGRDSPRVHVVVSQVEPFTQEHVAAAIPVAHRHPTLGRLGVGAGVTHRVSDSLSLPEFWETDVWSLMHGRGNGRYPAAALLCRGRRTMTFVGVHRIRRDFDADDMVVLDRVRQPLSAALALAAAWQDAAARCRSGFAEPDRGLTDREEQVIGLVALGWTNTRIGRHLQISERTVRKHLENVYDKLGAANRAAAVDRWRPPTERGYRLAPPPPSRAPNGWEPRIDSAGMPAPPIPRRA